jgi:hypothetical protein
MDGRAQLPVINWMMAQYKLDCVDMITEPGVDKVMAAGGYNQLEALKAKAMISVGKHGSRLIVIVGHDDCAGNPVTPEEHKAHLLKAVDKILAWKLPVDKVMALWLNKDWRVEIVAEKKS